MRSPIVGPAPNVSNSADTQFLAPRRCFREPIQEIFQAAELLKRATDAHLAGEGSQAEALIREADFPLVRMWTDSLWGSAVIHSDQPTYLRRRHVEGAPAVLSKADRMPARMPSSAQKAGLIERFGHQCVFCRIPLIRKEVRLAFTAAYPQAAYWGNTTATCHAAFQCMWLQYDHVLPHSRGGDNSLENLVVTCAGCNYGRMSSTLDEVGLMDPREFPIEKRAWDGLERFLRNTSRGS